MQKIVVLALIGSILGGPVALFAQDPDSTAVAVVSLPRPGFLHDAIGREATRAAQSAGSAQPAPEVPHRSWIKRHPVGGGALIGSAYPAVGTLVGMCAGHLATAKQKKYEAPASAPDIRSVQRVVTGVGFGKEVTVTTANGNRMVGNIAGVGGEQFSITAGGQLAAVPISYADVRDIRGKPMSIGAKTGIVACTAGAVVFLWGVCYGVGGCGGRS